MPVDKLGKFFIPDDAFAASVLSEIPELAEASTDWQRVTLLRNWAWSHIDYVHHNHVADKNCRWKLDDPKPKGWNDQTAPQYFAHFANGEGGVLCCGTACGLRILCEHFGLRAWHFDNADADSQRPGHCQTLVEIEHDGRSLLTLQDASFNLAYVETRSGDPIDYLEIIDRLRRRDVWSIRALETDYLAMKRYPRMYFPASEINGRTPDEIQRLYYPVQDSNYTFETLADGSLRYTSPRTWDKFVRVRAHDIRTGHPTNFVQWWMDHGYGADHGAHLMLYAHLWPIKFTSKTGADEDLKARINDVLR